MISAPPISLDAVSTVTRQRTEGPFIPLQATIWSLILHSQEIMQVASTVKHLENLDGDDTPTRIV